MFGRVENWTGNSIDGKWTRVLFGFLYQVELFFLLFFLSLFVSLQDFFFSFYAANALLLALFSLSPVRFSFKHSRSRSSV